MAPRTVELVARGPPPLDPYAPAAGTWALARAYAERGDAVHVLYPEGPKEAEPFEGIRATAVPLPLRRPGAAIEEAEFARRAGHRLRAESELVLRDPVGIGPLGVRARAPRARLVGLVRAVELAAFDRERAGRPGTGFVDRLDGWRDRRSLRRLERAALEEPEALFGDDPALADALEQEYQVGPPRLRAGRPPVPYLPGPPRRDAARGALGIPTDVPVVVVPAASPSAEESGIDHAREAFRRVRPFFPGARLVVVGTEAPPDPGVVSVPGRDAAAFAGALTAGDVALIVSARPGFDPGIVFAARAGCATIAYRSTVGAAPPANAVRTVGAEDPGDLASALADLVADLGAARELAERGKEFAETFGPDRVIAEIDRALGVERP